MRSRFVVTDQADGVSLGVLYEGHPLVHPGRSQVVVGVAEDDMRFGNDLDTVGAQGFDRRAHVIDLQVDQHAGGSLLEQQAYRTCLKEQQARRIEETRWFCVEQTLVKGPRTLQVIGVLCDLKDLHGASFAWLGAVAWRQPLA
jgi:gamma-glutamylcyclotransferase (GGCT)/AIG2-like uncharacterized protein YtfP